MFCLLFCIALERLVLELGHYCAPEGMHDSRLEIEVPVLLAERLFQFTSKCLL